MLLLIPPFCIENSDASCARSLTWSGMLKREADRSKLPSCLSYEGAGGGKVFFELQ